MDLTPLLYGRWSRPHNPQNSPRVQCWLTSEWTTKHHRSSHLMVTKRTLLSYIKTRTSENDNISLRASPPSKNLTCWSQWSLRGFFRPDTQLSPRKTLERLVYFSRHHKLQTPGIPSPDHKLLSFQYSKMSGLLRPQKHIHVQTSVWTTLPRWAVSQHALHVSSYSKNSSERWSTATVPSYFPPHLTTVPSSESHWLLRRPAFSPISIVFHRALFRNPNNFFFQGFNPAITTITPWCSSLLVDWSLLYLLLLWTIFLALLSFSYTQYSRLCLQQHHT